ncbi:MAG: hypothetical protein ACK55Z_01455, partial [bacterium]
LEAHLARHVDQVPDGLALQICQIHKVYVTSWQGFVAGRVRPTGHAYRQPDVVSVQAGRGVESRNPWRAGSRATRTQRE